MHTPITEKSTTFFRLLLLPAVLIIGGFILIPVVYNLYLSLFQKHPFVETSTFVGLSNYWELLQDHEFYESFINGVIYSGCTIFLQIVTGIALALLLNQQFYGSNLFRGALLFPYLIPTVMVVILWKWLLNSSYGLINYLLQEAHLISLPIVWFSEDNIMFTLIILSVWQFFPFVLVMVLARLQAIPDNLYKSAQIDGVPTLHRFLHITLPQLRSVIISIILLRSIWMFTKFDTVWLLAGSQGVGKYIQTLPILSYRKTFTYLQAGMGATVSVLMLLIVLVGAGLYYKKYMRDTIPL